MSLSIYISTIGQLLLLFTGQCPDAAMGTPGCQSIIDTAALQRVGCSLFCLLARRSGSVRVVARWAGHRASTDKSGMAPATGRGRRTVHGGQLGLPGLEERKWSAAAALAA